jgi:hypothetical protein
MKRMLFYLWLCCATPAFAQAVPGTAALPTSEDYQRIEETRARETALLDAQEATCYQRFSVNDCLKKVQSARRALLADLKRQETRLHDRERMQQGADQLQRAQQKALDRKQAETEAQENPGQAEEKLQAQHDKQTEHAAKGATVPATPGAAQPTGPSAAEQAAFRESYNAKQAAAEKKRQDIAKRLKDKGSKPVPPLPVPQ